MSNIAIKVKDVCRSYYVGTEKIDVLKKINFSIKKGEFVSIMGPSGCGKSTLLYILGALDFPDEGAVYIDGKDYREMKEKELAKMKCNEIGFIFQFYNLVPNLTVEENILLPLSFNKEKKVLYKERFEEIIKLTEIDSKLKVSPRELSGGQQQRVAIARALMINPKILFADEPIGNLDYKTGIKIMELFSEVNKKYKTTIVQVTHSEESAKYGNRIIRIKDGVIQK